MKKKGMKLVEIGRMQKPPITGERVRQIIEADSRKSCSRHGIMYFSFCKYCKVENEWQAWLAKRTVPEIEKEMRSLSKKGRDAVSSMKRKILVKKAVREWGIDFSELGRKMGRDRTTISHYYYSK